MKVTDKDTYQEIQPETIREWTINLDDIHSIGDATDTYLFQTEEPLVAIQYKCLDGATVYFVDNFIRVYNEWKKFEEYKRSNFLISKYN
jgi:Cu2+-containing amine oxidase